MEREKRKTAGRRMNDLVGEALDQDEQFWGHNTWAEDDNEMSDADMSYDMAEENKEDTVDRFDSDFNDSESEDDDENEEHAVEEDEPDSKRKSVYSEPASMKRKRREPATKMYKKGKHGVRRHVMAGEGINAGLVLSMPGKAIRPALANTALTPTPDAPISYQATVADLQTRIKQPPNTLPLQRTLRAKTVVKSKVAQTKQKLEEEAASKRKTSVKYKGQRRKFTQEELLLEAATITEPSNERWILSRSREMAQAEFELNNAAASKGAVSFRERFHSRRGCLNTITFPSIDLMPEILKGDHKLARRPTRRNTKCVITGKEGRYRDPKSGLPYFDLSAFKELQRRRESGEPLNEKDRIKHEVIDVKRVAKLSSPKDDGAKINETSLHVSSGPTNVCDGSVVVKAEKVQSMASDSSVITPAVDAPKKTTNFTTKLPFPTQMRESIPMLNIHGLPPLMMNPMVPTSISGMHMSMPPPPIKQPPRPNVQPQVKATPPTSCKNK